MPEHGTGCEEAVSDQCSIEAGCIQPAFVRYQRRLANTRILASLSMYELVTVLRTRAAIGEGCVVVFLRVLDQSEIDKEIVGINARRNDDVEFRSVVPSVRRVVDTG